MKDCRWLAPRLVGQFEFVEWTPDEHLRHSRFMGLRADKKPSDVIRERVAISIEAVDTPKQADN
jgi:bifunctional non-homologous end joining protein LigD